MLSFIVPARDEERLLASAVAACADAATVVGVPYEIVVVDDGSRDRTAEIARSLEHVTLVTHDRGQGLGAAVRSGLGAASGTWCLVSPADHPHTPSVLAKFLDAARDADLVLGYRPRRLGYSLLMHFNTRLYHAVLRLLCGLRWRDVNWIHLYRRSHFTDLTVRSSGVCAAAETVLEARARGYRIREVECPMVPRRQGVASAARPSVMLRTALGLLLLVWRYGRRR